jgi:hypothetical protein
MLSKADILLNLMPWLLKIAISLYDDQEWYADSSAKAHITNDVDNLHLQQPFQNFDTIAVGNDYTLAIANSGSATLHSPCSDFSLKHVLHCSKAAVNLISIQCFCLDNDCYFILTSTRYYILDMQIQALLLEGKSENGMYPIRRGKKSHKGSKAFTTALGIKTTPLVWHFRLGHPSSEVVNRVVQENKLPISTVDINKTSLCTSCQLGKSKKLLFHSSNRIFESPLHLIHTDIWTCPILSMSGYKYYALFVDDYSRSLNKEVYVEQNQGFVDPSYANFVCKLNKALYDLKQAHRAWFTRLSNFLFDLSFTVSLVDTSLFILAQGGIKLFILIYVDDIIVTGTHTHLFSGLIHWLQQEFIVKDLGPLLSGY